LFTGMHLPFASVEKRRNPYLVPRGGALTY